MHKTSLILFFFSLSSMAAWENFPIQVRCMQGEEQIISLSVSSSTNQSRLFYKTPEMVKAVLIYSGGAAGINSSSSVSIESSQGDSLSRNQVLRFSAHKSEVTRILTYQNYEFELEMSSGGGFIGKKLRYARGKDAFPDTQEEGIIIFKNLTCTVTGL